MARSICDEWAYTYDAKGRVASRNRSGGAGTLAEVLGYDEAGRLATINTNPVSYDPNGNRLSGPGMPTQTFRADNAIATGAGSNGNGTEAYQYTPWGGLARDACKTYNYDGFDRAHRTNIRKTLDLIPRCDALGDLLTANDEKRYDPLGRNVWARHARVFVLGEPTLTEYQNLYPVGLGQDIAYEQTVGDADRSGRYVNTPDGTPLAVTDLNGDYQFLHRDGQGNTVAAINPGGSVACAPNLSDWGKGGEECDDLLNPATPNRKWYNSSRLDTTTETYQWGTRTYNPETATWQQPDTAALSGAPDSVSIGTDPLVANRYAYVNGDPINYTDPSGHIMIEGNGRSTSGHVQHTTDGRLYLADGGAWKTADFVDAVAELEVLTEESGFSVGDYRAAISAVATGSEAHLKSLAALDSAEASRLLEIVEQQLAIAKNASISPTRWQQALRLFGATGTKQPTLNLLQEAVFTQLERYTSRAAIAAAPGRASTAGSGAAAGLRNAQRLRGLARGAAAVGIGADAWFTLVDIGDAESGREIAEEIGGLGGRSLAGLAAGYVVMSPTLLACSTGVGCVGLAVLAGFAATPPGEYVGEKAGAGFFTSLESVAGGFQCMARFPQGC